MKTARHTRLTTIFFFFLILYKKAHAFASASDFIFSFKIFFYKHTEKEKFFVNVNDIIQTINHYSLINMLFTFIVRSIITLIDFEFEPLYNICLEYFSLKKYILRVGKH